MFSQVRKQTQLLCDPLETEDFVVQPSVDVSPLKWHLAHTTWFFEAFVLLPHIKNYRCFNEKYLTLFNSYYISAGDRWTREKRGQLTRPTVHQIFEYRAYVDEALDGLLSQDALTPELQQLITLGCHHEQQHQELFLYDVKRILGDNPLFPVYRTMENRPATTPTQKEWLGLAAGNYPIGFEGDGFHFDNEKGRHTVYLHDFEMASTLVTNGEYLAFIEAGGYSHHALWLSEGWDWVNKNQIKAPRYWHFEDGGLWKQYSLGGLKDLPLQEPVSHISYYEADAYARWKGCRLPTEFEWEVACTHYEPEKPKGAHFLESNHLGPVEAQTRGFYGNLWEWTSSPYTAYPFFNIAKGALGEYNGKFMINQMVLRGGSYGSTRDHIRNTYRNFFHPHLRWMFAGIRLAKHLS